MVSGFFQTAGLTFRAVLTSLLSGRGTELETGKIRTRLFYSFYFFFFFFRFSFFFFYFQRRRIPAIRERRDFALRCFACVKSS